MSDGMTAAKPALKANQTLIMGRIEKVLPGFEMNGRKVHQARIAQPAADQYSSPGFVLVESSSRIGQAGDDVKLMCEVTGWKDRFTSKNSGEVVETARNVLRVVD